MKKVCRAQIRLCLFSVAWEPLPNMLYIIDTAYGPPVLHLNSGDPFPRERNGTGRTQGAYESPEGYTLRHFGFMCAATA